MSHAEAVAFHKGVRTAAQMVRKCAELDQLKESLRICPEAGLEAIARAIETLSREMHYEP